MTAAVDSQMTTAPAKTDEIRPLTSFRLFAVVLVFLSHLAGYGIFPEPYDRFFFEGYVGVTFFFVLSGFILTYKYYSRIAGLDVSELKNFYVSRIARIYPVHILTFFIALPLTYRAIPADLISEGVRALLNLSLLQSFVPTLSYYSSYNLPSWSLSDEVFFYALFPFVLALLLRARLATAVRAVGLGIALWLFTLLTIWWLRDIETSQWLFYIAPFSRLLDFLIGALSCIVFQKIGRGANAPKIVFTLFELVSLAAFSLAFYISPAVHQSLRYGVYYQPFIVLIIFLFALQKGHLSGLLSARLLVLGGEISFSFYLFHQLVMRYFLLGGLFEPNPVLVGLIAFLVTICLSYICYWLYESPARDILRRRFAAHRGAGVKSPAVPAVPAPLAGAHAPPHTAGFPGKLIGGSSTVIAAVVLVTYYPSLRLGFLGEIWSLLEAAGKLALPQYMASALDATSIAAAYQALPAVLLYAGYQVFHADSLGYHVFSLLLHLATVGLLFCTVWEIGKNMRAALLSALVFAGLSIYTQSVFNPMDPHLEVGPFYLLSVWAWVRYLRTANFKFYLLTVAALGLAWAIASTSITLAITLFAVDRLLIRDRQDWAKLFRRYAFLGLLTFSLVTIEYLVRGSSSTVLGGISFQTLVNLAEYLALLLFPWGFDFPIIFALAPLVAAIYVLVAVRKRSAVLAFLGIAAVLLLIPDALLPRAPFTPRAFYLPAMLFAVAFAICFCRLWGESGHNKPHVVTAASAALALVVLFNGAGITVAANSWTDVVRRTRQAYREIAPRHPTFGDDTYLYFVGPPSTRDLSGLFYSRYGSAVIVASSYEDASASRVPYPSLQKTGSDGRISSEATQMAGLRQHKTAFVYHFADDGKTIEVPVAPDAVTAPTPALPVTFNVPIRLEGYEITANTLKTGDALVLVLYWRATQPIVKDYTVFVHLVTSRGEMLDGYDTQPRSGKAPTSLWPPGALVVDCIAFPIAANIPGGADYRLEIGLYDATTMERLLLVDEHGAPFADQVVIAPIRIVRTVP